jgi:uncharacterized protein YdhG (YjbR/CyaY superfamily)
LSLPEEQRPMVDYLREFIKKHHAGITERIAYGLPFFYFVKPLCYLNILKEGVDIGFMDGNKITQRPEFNAEKRKRVRSLLFRWEEDIDLELLEEVLAEAIDYIKVVRLT